MREGDNKWSEEMKPSYTSLGKPSFSKGSMEWKAIDEGFQV